ncbi:MAG TPA: alpha/beta hydrolase [Thermoanaerobaculia bacterium]
MNAFLALLLLLSSPAADRPVLLTVSGSVVVSGEIPQPARIVLRASRNVSVMTEADGTFSFDVTVEPGEYPLLVHALSGEVIARRVIRVMPASEASVSLRIQVGSMDATPIEAYGSKWGVDGVRPTPAQAGNDGAHPTPAQAQSVGETSVRPHTSNNVTTPTAMTASDSRTDAASGIIRNLSNNSNATTNQITVVAPAAVDRAVRDAVERKNLQTVRVFYATNRKRSGSSHPATFYCGERGPLELGIVDVSVPARHNVGDVEAPGIFTWVPNPEKHWLLVSVTPTEREDFMAELRARIFASPGRDAFVFVHGYNVTFEEAARRTASLARDLQFRGAPILYSWPSFGSYIRYWADEASVQWSSEHLRRFLADVARSTGAQAVHVIAHSMGSRAVATALADIAKDPIMEPFPVFQEVVLTAPDIDAATLEQLATHLRRSSGRVTLYASSRDWPIRLSRFLHAYRIAAQSGRTIDPIEGFETIDVTAVDTSLAGRHDYNGPTVLADLHALIRDRKAAKDRYRLEMRRAGDEVRCSARARSTYSRKGSMQRPRYVRALAQRIDAAPALRPSFGAEDRCSARATSELWRRASMQRSRYVRALAQRIDAAPALRPSFGAKHRCSARAAWMGSRNRSQ